jgi:hypothetical protein
MCCAWSNKQNGLTFNADLAATAFVQEQSLIKYILTVLCMRDVRPISRGFSNDQARTAEKALKVKGMRAAITALVLALCAVLYDGAACYMHV